MAMKRVSVKNIELILGITAAERRIRMATAPRCKICNLTPYQIPEYLHNSKGMDPAEYVRETERMASPNKFYCTSCYIKVGMPVY